MMIMMKKVVNDEKDDKNDKNMMIIMKRTMRMMKRMIDHLLILWTICLSRR